MSSADRARKSLALPSIWGHIPGSTSFLPCVGLYVAFGIYCSVQPLWASVLSALMWGGTLADRHIYSASSGPDLNWLMIGHLFNLLNQLLDIYSSRLWLLYSVLTFLGFILCITTIGVLGFNTWGVCMNITAQNSQVIKSYYKRGNTAEKFSWDDWTRLVYSHLFLFWVSKHEKNTDSFG